MDTKKVRIRIGRFLGWVGLIFCSLIVKLIPFSWMYKFADAVAFVGYHIASKQRGIALESLDIAFSKEKSPCEIEKIVRDCFYYMAKSGVELLFLMDRPKLLKDRVTIIGRENLDKAISQGKGVILVSAHFGNFPLMLVKLSLEGYKVAGIMRLMRDNRAESFFSHKRAKLGLKTVYSQPRKKCVEDSIRTLRNNELLFIPLDQNFGTAGVFVDFFGTKAATATGPVVLAQRTQASILPCFIIRNSDDTHQIMFEPALTLKQGVTQEETVLKNIQEITKIMEAYIRRYPAEWGWIHRRWKTKPKGGVIWQKS